MLLDTAAAAMILLAEAKAEAVASGVTATTTSTSTSTSTCHKYQYKRAGSGSKQGKGREGKERGKKPGKYSSCEVATQDKRHRARTRHCFLAESVLNTFRTYLKCCSLPLPPPPLPAACLLHSLLLAALPLQCAPSSATLFLHDLPHGYSSICRSQRNLHIIYNGQTFKASFTPAGQTHPIPAHTLANTHKAL